MKNPSLLSPLFWVLILFAPFRSFSLDLVPTGYLTDIENYQFNTINKVTIYTTEGSAPDQHNLRTTIVDFQGYNKLGAISTLKNMAYAVASLVTNFHFNPASKFTVFLQAKNDSSVNPNVAGFNYPVASITAEYYIEPNGQGGFKMKTIDPQSLNYVIEISPFLCIKRNLRFTLNGGTPNTLLAKMTLRDSAGMITNTTTSSDPYTNDLSLTNMPSGNLFNAYMHGRLVIRKSLLIGGISGEIEMQYADGATRSYQLQTGEQIVSPANIGLVFSNSVPNVIISGNSNETVVVEYTSDPVFGIWNEVGTFPLPLDNPRTNHLDTRMFQDRRFYKIRYQ